MSKTIKLYNRGLKPPQPMIRTLEQLELMDSGETLIIHNDRKPMFLFPELDELGYPYEVEPHPEGGFQVTIHKP